MGIDSTPVTHSPLITHLTFKQSILNQSEEIITDRKPIFKKPKPIRKPEPIKKSIVEKVAVKKVLPLKNIKKKESVKQEIPQSQPQPRGQPNSLSSIKTLQRKRELYLQKLLSHIESFKFYPKAARRRAIEGDVKISFILRDSGRYGQLVLTGERSVLVNATRIALEAATPLPTPADNLGDSRQIEFTMVYLLN